MAPTEPPAPEPVAVDGGTPLVAWMLLGIGLWVVLVTLALLFKRCLSENACPRGLAECRCCDACDEDCHACARCCEDVLPQVIAKEEEERRRRRRRRRRERK